MPTPTALDLAIDARPCPEAQPPIRPCSFGIIGGGWYGCHIATSLRALGFRVKVFEQHDRLLHEGSGNNQFRLHLGFHYARHSDTRIQSRDGFLRFLERYPHLSRSVPYNIYAVPLGDSLLDYGTYRGIMVSSGLRFTEGPPPESARLTNVAAQVLHTAERVLLPTKARAHFEAELHGALKLGHQVAELQTSAQGVLIDGEHFDFAVDATWGHLVAPSTQVIYEPTLLLYYEGPPDFPAVTLVDGPLCSVYPTEAPGLFTLSSVPHTPLGQFATAAEARAVRDSIRAETIAAKRALMEAQIARYLPGFPELFHYINPQVAIKTKVVAAHDDRSCTVSRRGRVFSVLSGKIDGVFFATERILELLDASIKDGMSSLRRDIALVSSRASLNDMRERI